MLIGAGGYLAERAADLADIRDRVIAVVLGLPMPGIPEPGHPFVLLADDLSPADTATLDPSRVLALVTERGGTTSHTAILARSLGLPCVVGCTGIMDVADGTLVGVDAGAGTVVVGILESEVAAIADRAEALAASVKSVSGPGRTADGHPVALLHNIGSADDLGSLDDSFEGIGLFRTEFLFLDRHDRPSFDEQRQAYCAVLKAVDGHKVTVRTLDAGADKPLPFLDMEPEPNPALGIRGLRIGMRSVDVLDEQLGALAAAAADVPGSDVWVMAPMVATAAEAKGFTDLAHEHGLTIAGVMVEIPAAALRAADLLEHADFMSIGTNDLAQYTLAVDRMAGELADLLDPWQPALLDLIRMTAEAGLAAGKSVGVCGEAAASPLLAPVLVGLGVTSLSMSASAVADVRDALAAVTLAECREMAANALAGRTTGRP
jgi:phosphotransferase system enzyme I (PtsI)